MKIYTVKECSSLVSITFQKDYIFRNITVRGTISNLNVHFSGNTFFSLIDENFRIFCKIGKMRSTFLGRNLKNGIEASVIGDLRYDKTGGKPILHVERIISVTESPLSQEINLLEEELDKKGYFALSNKKELPEFPFHIGIITSGSGAVIYDILKTGNIRNNSVSYSLYSTEVQGDEASANMANMVKLANQENEPPDILIIARGGGAEEDLRPFNNKVLLDAVFESKIPIISAVGHERDMTLLDRVSDVRASTPTQAAEIAIPLKEYMIEKIFSFLSLMDKEMKKNISEKKTILNFTIKEFRYISCSKDFSLEKQKIFLQWLLLKNLLIENISDKKSVLTDYMYKIQNNQIR